VGFGPAAAVLAAFATLAAGFVFVLALDFAALFFAAGLTLAARFFMDADGTAPVRARSTARLRSRRSS
jgi:hypothetical protein